MNEIDLGDSLELESEVIYRWSWAGKLARRWTIVRRTRKWRVVKTGIVLGFVVSVVVSCLVLLILWRFTHV